MSLYWEKKGVGDAGGLKSFYSFGRKEESERS